MWTQKFLSQLLESLADERRRVTASWRLVVHANRLVMSQHERLRSTDTAETLLRKMRRAGHLESIDGVENVYTINVPYANVLPISDEQILQEAHPWAVLSHLTALIYHQLSDSVPSSIYATAYAKPSRIRPPLGTTPEDWLDVSPPKPTKPKHIDGVPVVWVAMKESLDWGSEVGDSQGVSVYVTDLERTLLDALRQPTRAGGDLEIMRAWGRARDRIDVDRIVEYTERYGIKVMRQRVGFLFKSMQIQHPRLESWKRNLLRGGSIKLIADNEYGTLFDAEWNISLNLPESALEFVRPD